MKKFFIFCLSIGCGWFFSVPSYANTAELTLEVTCRYNLEEGVVNSSFHPFTLSSEGQNSKYLSMTLSHDMHSGLLVSLNHAGNRCSDHNCDSFSGKMYNLTLVRVESDIKAAMNFQKLKEAEGQTSSTVEITRYNNGDIKSNYVGADGQVIYSEGGGGLPEAVSIDYSVERLDSGRQNIKVSCLIKLK